MRANVDKFQAIMSGKFGFENCKSLNIVEVQFNLKKRLDFWVSFLIIC